MRLREPREAVARPWFALALLLVLPRPTPAWERLEELEGAEVVFDLLEGQDGTLYAGTYPGGVVFVSIDSGVTWNAAAPLPGAIMAYALAELADATVVAGTFPLGDVFATSDRGATWTRYDGPPAELATEVHSLLLASNGSLLAGCAPLGHVFVSTDGGASWPTGVQLSASIVPWCLAEWPAGTLWAGTTRQKGLFRSIDWGMSWVNTGTFHAGGETLTSPSIASMLPRPREPALYAGLVMRGHGSMGGVFKSTDAGVNWYSLDGLRYCHGVWALLETRGGEIWAGLSTIEADIVYSSTDGGATWSSTGSLAGAREVLALLQTRSGDILAGTAPNGDIFRHDPPPTDAEGDAPALAAAPVQFSTWPNPSASNATLAFRLAGAADLALEIYRPDGRLVRTLVAARLAPGSHSILWDGRDTRGFRVGAGVYLGVLRTGGERFVRKVALLSPQ
jgi:photosystem II stability/assembly factor-like uncharacterized protein